MPMRGRKPLPSNVVRLRGNPGKRRLNEHRQARKLRFAKCFTGGGFGHGTTATIQQSLYVDGKKFIDAFGKKSREQ